MKTFEELREILNKKVEENVDNLTSDSILEISRKVDELVISSFGTKI